MAKSTFTYVSYIRTSSAKLWRALTTAEIIKQYWFGMRIEGGWRVGSSWAMYYDGSMMDSGKILEHTPGRRLVRSWRNEWSPALKAEGSSRCVYELKPAGKHAVKLTVTHSMARPHSKFIRAVSEGWPMCLANLKSLLETGKIVLANHPGH